MTPPPSSPLGRIAIIGSGAIGCYYGGRLARHGHEVHFLMRSDYAAVKREGLRIESPQGGFHLPEVLCHRTTEEIGPCDLVVIALKTTANAALPDLLAPLLHGGTVLLTLQNGLGNEEFLAAHFGGRQVLGGLCFVCINRTAPGMVRHLAQGRISLGAHGRAPSEREQAIAAEFMRSGIDCVVEESLAAARWKKLVWNIPFNGLSIARGGKDTAALLADPAIEDEVRSLMTEIVTTARAMGHAMPPGLADDMIERTRTMTSYKPSSLVDFEAGREIEIEPIWGEPVRRAEAAGLHMPRVRALYEELQARASAAASQAP